MTTMQDVAKLAGVSAKTVSRVFNGDPHVTEETRQRVADALKELRYIPNMMARTFRSGRPSVVGIAVPDVGDPFFAAIIRSIDRVARAQGMAIAVTSLGDDPAVERVTVEALLRLTVAGLIIAPVSDDQGYLAPWATHVPVVFIDRGPNGVAADSFVEDDLGGAMAVTRLLYVRGHRRIAFIGDVDSVVTSRQRQEGYRQALVGLGLEVDEDLIALGPTERAEQLVAQVLGGSDPPTAIFSSNARTSLGVFPALQRLGRTDVALVSFGDFPMAAALQPSVTVVDQDPERLGRVAAERLFRRMAAPEARLRRRNVLAVDIVERASTAPAASSSAAAGEVAAAAV